jgi:hypothetical protein
MNTSFGFVGLSPIFRSECAEALGTGASRDAL